MMFLEAFWTEPVEMAFKDLFLALGSATRAIFPFLFFFASIGTKDKGVASSGWGIIALEGSSGSQTESFEQENRIRNNKFNDIFGYYYNLKLPALSWRDLYSGLSLYR